MSTPSNSQEHNNLSVPLTDGVVPEQVVVATERRWLTVVAAILSVMVLVIIITGITNNLHPPSNAETIDPSRVYQSAEFSEGNLGSSADGNGQVSVRMIAQQYSFVPACVVVPLGPSVTFRLASADVVHGFLIAGTNVNSMVVPGYISSATTRFSHTGVYRMPCHEFCGLGHAGMAAEIRVVPAADYTNMSPNERMRCDAR